MSDDLEAGPAVPWAGPVAELAWRLGDLNPSPAARETPDHGLPGAGSTEVAGLSPAETSGPAMGDRERNKKRLLELLQAAGTGNGHCADCGAAGKGAVCGAGAASHGPAPGPLSPSLGARQRATQTRSSLGTPVLLAGEFQEVPTVLRLPAPEARHLGPRSASDAVHPLGPSRSPTWHLTTQEPALDTISDPRPFPRPRTLRSLPRCLLGLRDPHCRAMTEDADVAGSRPQASERVPHSPALLGSPFRGLLGVVKPKGGLSTVLAVTSVVQGWGPREKGLPAWAELASDPES